MSSPIPEEPQASASDLEPEAASGVVEELRDEATVASLEDQKIKLIALLSAFDGNPEGLADQRLCEMRCSKQEFKGLL